MCFLPNCRCQILLLSGVQQLQQKQEDAMCFTCQHADFLYAVFKYRYNRKKVAKSGQLFEKEQKAAYVNQQNRELSRMRSNAKRRELEGKVHKHLLSSFQKTKSMQSSVSMFAETF